MPAQPPSSLAPPVLLWPNGNAETTYAITIDGDMAIPDTWVNGCVFAYLSADRTIEMPQPVLGQWLLIQNATDTLSGWILTIAANALWSGVARSVAASDYVKYRAMDKNGTILWREAP